MKRYIYSTLQYLVFPQLIGHQLFRVKQREIRLVTVPISDILIVRLFVLCLCLIDFITHLT